MIYLYIECDKQKIVMALASWEEGMLVFECRDDVFLRQGRCSEDKVIIEWKVIIFLYKQTDLNQCWFELESGVLCCS